MVKMQDIEDNLCVVGDTNELIRIREFIIERAKEFGFTDDEAFRISLAVDEACTNLIKYALKSSKEKKICIRTNHETNIFIIEILDNGAPFDPLTVASPDMKEYLQKYRRGGLGIHIMRSVMDAISYIPSSGSSTVNTLKLTKVLS
jgi:anti-sigma regulatory factor (Ser/Thr protein kinase)